jgi:prepilin-type N-terminal cleavage/methylation domain-containing protein
MIVSKSRDGFTLIETLFALAIFALSMVPLLMLQSRMLLSIANFSERMHRIVIMKNFMFESRREFLKKEDAKQFSIEKKIDFPATVLRYKIDPISDKSALKRVKAVYNERVTAEWLDGGLKQQEVLISVFFKPPAEKEKGSTA